MSDRGTVTNSVEAREGDTPRRTYVQAVVRDLLGRGGALFGLSWLVIMVLVAIFAPFIANSYPLLAQRADGGWEAPVFQHLTWADHALLTFFVTLLAGLLIRPLTMGWRLLVIAVPPLMVAAIMFFAWSPSAIQIYSQPREMLAAGDYQHAIFAPIPYSPNDRQRDVEDDDPRYLSPRAEHIMGTDPFGQDVASRLIHGTRIALTIGFIATGISLVIGVTLGALMGYFSGLVDLFGMRLVEVFAAIPVLFLLITIVATYEERNIYLMMVVIGLVSWVGFAIFTRAEFLKLRQQDFIQAAIACGLPLRSILFRHMLPNAMAPILVLTSFGVAGAILMESTLSFLGLGLVEEPSWGGMMERAHSGADFYWWIGTFPGMAIFLTVFAYNLLGEALRDAIDPSTSRAAE